MKQALFFAALALVVSTATAADADQNSWSYMTRKNGNCANTYSTVVESRFYATNETCKNAVKAALSTFNKSTCPDTSKKSLVWSCMSGWNGTAVEPARITAWTTFLSQCELLYIAQRANTAESEDGFVWIDNSCFGRYVNMGQFVSFLRDDGDGGNAEKVVFTLFNFAIAIVAALFFARL